MMAFLGQLFPNSVTHQIGFGLTVTVGFNRLGSPHHPPPPPSSQNCTVSKRGKSSLQTSEILFGVIFLDSSSVQSLQLIATTQVKGEIRHVPFLLHYSAL
jgi:hypothetical protein